MTVLVVLTVLAVLESTLASFCLSCKIQYQEATVTVSAGVAVSVVTANSTPPSLRARLQNEVGTKYFFGGTNFS